MYGDGSTKLGLFSKVTNQEYPTVKVQGKEQSIEQWFGKDREVNHLFVQKTYKTTGYFEYNSAKNFATLGTDNNNNDFTVYNQLGTPSDQTSYKGETTYFYQRGNFMPFNTLNTSRVLNRNLYDDQGKKLEDTDPRYNEALYGFNEENPNYYFGVYATADFYQPVGGQVNNGQDMIYEFTGDDDMVVYIDGVLVLDLGGIHDAQSGAINFKTGEVKYTNQKTGDQTKWNYTDIKSQFKEAEQLYRTTWKGNTFADGSQHRIQIFYMERGAGASNLKLKVNIPPIPDGSVNIQKTVEGLDATQAREEEYTLQLLIKDNATGTFKEAANQPYTLSSGTNSYVTDSNGQFTVHANETANFSKITANSEIQVKEVNTGEIYEVSYKAVDSTGKEIPPTEGNGTISATVPSAGHVDVTVKNDATKKTKSLTINKEFLVNGTSGSVPNLNSFENATFTLQEKGKEDESYRDLYSGIKYSSFTDGKYTFSTLDPRKTYRVIENLTNATGGTTAIPYVGTDYKIGDTETNAVSQEGGNPTSGEIRLKNQNEEFINQTVTFINKYQTPTKDVSFTKVDAENRNTVLTGAVFALYTDQNASTPYIKDDYNVTATANANGIVTFSGLPYRSDTETTYYMKETKAPTGYVLSDEIYTVQITPGTNGPTVSISGNGATTVENVTKISNTPVNLTFYKKANDSNHTLLEGAKIKIEKKVDYNTYQPVTGLTSVDGLTLVDGEGQFEIPRTGITFNKMPDGEYRITEVTAPAGYNLLTKSYEFSISNGRLVQPATSSDPQVTIESPKDGAITITIFNTPGRVLPGTGGMGTFLYNLSGLALMLTALVYIIHARHGQKGGLN